MVRPVPKSIHRSTQAYTETGMVSRVCLFLILVFISKLPVRQ